jgi:hypothetical protein
MAHTESQPANLPDPFNPASLRINPATAATVGVKKLITTVPARKPNRQVFVRVHPDAAYRLTTAVIEHKEDNEIYLVAPSMLEALADEVAFVTLFTAIDRQGNLFLWPVKLPKDDGRANAWHLSARAAAEEAMKAWVRVSANMGAQAYDVFRATGNLPEPEWPDLDLQKILKVAFRDRFIEDDDHPVIKKLEGRS